MNLLLRRLQADLKPPCCNDNSSTQGFVAGLSSADRLDKKPSGWHDVDMQLLQCTQCSQRISHSRGSKGAFHNCITYRNTCMIKYVASNEWGSDTPNRHLFYCISRNLHLKKSRLLPCSLPPWSMLQQYFNPFRATKQNPNYKIPLPNKGQHKKRMVWFFHCGYKMLHREAIENI